MALNINVRAGREEQTIKSIASEGRIPPRRAEPSLQTPSLERRIGTMCDQRPDQVRVNVCDRSVASQSHSYSIIIRP